jgi:hypothetical protein
MDLVSMPSFLPMMTFFFCWNWEGIGGIFGLGILFGQRRWRVTNTVTYILA